MRPASVAVNVQYYNIERIIKLNVNNRTLFTVVTYIFTVEATFHLTTDIGRDIPPNSLAPSDIYYVYLM